jgi:hypothetical protein
MIPVPLIIAGVELLMSSQGKSKEENEEIVKATLKKHAIPFYKDKKFMTAIVAVVASVASHFLGFPITDLVCTS